jgi:flagellar biosynthesis/type III secretory pathway protein FliH
MSKARNWSQVPFHAHEERAVAWFPGDRIAPTAIETLDLPDVSNEARHDEARTASEPEVPPVDMEAEMEAVRELAEKEGRAKGREEAEAKHQRTIEKLQKEMDGVVRAMRSGLDRAELDSDRDAVRLGILVAEHVLRRRLTEDAESIASSLTASAEELEGMEPLTIACGPDGAETVRDHLTALQETLQIAGIQVEEDEGLAPGDFLLRRGDATVDARITPRLERIRETISEALGFDAAPKASGDSA